MANKYESKWNIEDLTDPEIYEAIRYLEPEQTTVNQQNDETGFVICFCVVIVVLGWLAFTCLYYR
jgi:hypothetical protein